MARIRDLMAIAQLQAYGTSEGARKAWDTRGRGRKAEEKTVSSKRAFRMDTNNDTVGGERYERLESLGYVPDSRPSRTRTGLVVWRHPSGAKAYSWDNFDSPSMDRHGYRQKIKLVGAPRQHRAAILAKN